MGLTLYKKGGGKRGKPGEFPLSPMGRKVGEGGKRWEPPFREGVPPFPAPRCEDTGRPDRVQTNQADEPGDIAQPNLAQHRVLW
jgi:hypothetical protein